MTDNFERIVTIVERDSLIMFNNLDGLKKRGIDDTEVLSAMIETSFEGFAAEYAQWQGVPLPKMDDADGGVVPDPDNDSYAPLRDALDADRARRNADLGQEIIAALEVRATQLQATVDRMQAQAMDVAGPRPLDFGHDDLIRYAAYAAEARAAYQSITALVQGKR